MNYLRNLRLELVQKIDENAKSLAGELYENGKISEKILRTIIDLYASSKVEQDLKGKNFDSAYHTPVTGDLELFISRIIYHYLVPHDSNWRVLLRKQKSKAAPDIRIVNNNENIAIVEIKASAGWIQPFISNARYDRDKNMEIAKKTNFDPDKFIAQQKNQLDKYQEVFKLHPKDIFYLLPTVAAAHRKTDAETIADYHDNFQRVSGLPKENLILLSSNLSLKLSDNIIKEELCPTEDFENMLRSIKSKSK
jgi:hypothetical protein